MGDITDINSFRKKQVEYVYQCPCGSQHFYLNRDGTIACRSCELILEKVKWIYRSMKEPQ